MSDQIGLDDAVSDVIGRDGDCERSSDLIGRDMHSIVEALEVEARYRPPLSEQASSERSIRDQHSQ